MRYQGLLTATELIAGIIVIVASIALLVYAANM
jgi:hypothetical protein